MAVEQGEERIRDLESHLEAMAQEEPYRERVGWLRCFRGIETVTAMTILAELHDFRRFDDPRRLMSYLGLVPSEHSSGEKTRRGAITKAGNSHARRVLVESAWHYRHQPAVGVKLRRRRAGQPKEIIALADRAQRRLHRRFHRLVLGSGKTPQTAVVAISRELVGFLWAALYLYPATQAQARDVEPRPAQSKEGRQASSHPSPWKSRDGMQPARTLATTRTGSNG